MRPRGHDPLPAMSDGLQWNRSGDPAMRTGLSNLAIAQWIPVAYNQAAPKDAAGKPQIDKFLTDADRKLFMNALMKQCDAKDGLADGMIFDPLGCHFDPTILACKAGQSEGCIAPEKIAAIVPGLLALRKNGLFGPYTTATELDDIPPGAIAIPKYASRFRHTKDGSSKPRH